MAILRLSTPGFDYQTQQSIAQFVIPAGGGATYSATGNIATITTNAAHGLTLNPAAGVPPNYFVSFGGSTSGQTGVGVLVGNIFRILSIPSTTTFTIFCSITALTVTSMTVIPIFFCPFIASPASLFSGPQPTMTVAAVTTAYPPPALASGYVYAQLAANANIRINSDNTFSAPLDPYTTPQSAGVFSTPATAPTWTIAQPVSTSGGIAMLGWTAAVWAGGTTATSTLSVMN